MNKIPIYNAILSDENDRMICISLVDCPAVEDNFVAFNKQEEVKFSILNEEEKMVLGVVMRANFPIYRYSENMGEYYIKYSKETIKEMTQRFLADNNQNKINLMHESGVYQDGVQLVQIFIKDVEKGISPRGFEHIEDGSLFAQYHIENEEIWDKIKDGTFQGYSLEMYCTIEEDKNNFKKQNKNKMTIEKIKDVLRSLLVECNNTMSDKGNLFYNGDEIVVGTTLFGDSEMTTPIEDGVYETDEQVITITDGKVSEVKEKGAEEEPEVTEEPVEEEPKEEEKPTEEEPTEEEPVEEPTEEDEPKEEETPVEEEPEATEEPTEEVVEEPSEEPEVVDDVIAPSGDENAEIEALKAEIEALKGVVESILEKVNAPMAEPITEEFSKVEKTPIDKWDRYAQIINSIKK